MGHSFLLPDPRVGHRVQHVSQKVHRDIGQSNRQDAALHQIVIAVRDGLDGETADARPTKDRLGHDCAGQQRSELQAQHGDDGDHGVAQRVAVDDGALGQAFGAGGADVILAEFFEHGGAHHARQDGGQRAAHGDGGQHEIGERTRSGNGEPSQLDGEKKNQDWTQCEVGERQTEKANDAEQAVIPAVAALSGADAGGDRKNDGDEERCQRKLQRVGIALREQLRHALVVAE